MKQQAFHLQRGLEQPGKHLQSEVSSTSPAAPSSILFILQRRVPIRKSKLPPFLQAQLPISPSSENCSLLMEAAAAIRKSQAERGQSTGLTQRGCRAPAKAAALRASPGPGCLPAPSGLPGLLPSGRAALHRRRWLCPPGARDRGRGEGTEAGREQSQGKRAGGRKEQRGKENDWSGREG